MMLIATGCGRESVRIFVLISSLIFYLVCSHALIVLLHTGSKIGESLTHLGRIGRLAALGCIENPPVTLDGVTV